MRRRPEKGDAPEVAATGASSEVPLDVNQGSNVSHSIQVSSTSKQSSLFNFCGHTVRVVMRDGEPWFVITDVAKALGYRDAANAARNLPDHQRGTQIVSTPSGKQTLAVTNEPGLYRLVLRSRKPEALRFSDWVTGEVLPAIRKTGGYSIGDRERKATELASAAVAGVFSAVHNAVMTSNEPFGGGWKYGRWMLAFEAEHLRPYVRHVENDEFVASVKNFTKYVTDPGFMMDNKELITLASACMQRLDRRLGLKN